MLYVANPALIINSSQTESIVLGSELVTAVLGRDRHVRGADRRRRGYAENHSRGAKPEKHVRYDDGLFQHRVYGHPAVSELFGGLALLYVSVFILIFNILIYTYGVMILQRGTLQTAQNRFSFRKFINPGVISSIIAVMLYLLRIRLPDIVTAPLGYLSELTAPLGMMVIGATLASVKIRSFVTNGRLMIFSIIKLLILPIICGFALKHVIGAGELFTSAL